MSRYPSDGWTVTLCPGGDREIGDRVAIVPRYNPNAERDAALIAAAPMMAEALVLVLNAMHADNPEGLPLQYRGAADYADDALRAAGVIE